MGRRGSAGSRGGFLDASGRKDSAQKQNNIKFNQKTLGWGGVTREQRKLPKGGKKFYPLVYLEGGAGRWGKKTDIKGGGYILKRKGSANEKGAKLLKRGVG